MNTLRISLFAPLLAALAVSLHGQTVYSVAPTGSGYVISDHFYGSTATARNRFNWQSDPAFTTVLKNMNYALLRTPTGTGANYWEWQFGTMYKAYTDGSNANLSPLSELALEAKQAGAEPILVLNMLTQPSGTVSATPQQGEIDPAGGPPTTNGGPDNQLGTNGLIAKATSQYGAQDITLKYIELGNEYYFPGPPDYTSNDYISVYSDGGSYGTTAKNWIAKIEQNFPTGGYSYAAVGSPVHSSWGARSQNWNAKMLTNLSGENALTLHFYVDPNLPSPQTVPLNQTEAGNMFGAPAWMLNDIETNTLPTIGGKNFWMTEYNFQSGTASGQAYDSTWAHGLALAEMHLMYLEMLPFGLQMLVHYTTVYNNGTYADIFEDNNSLNELAGLDGNTTNPNPAPATVQWGLSAGGVVSALVNYAAQGQTTATKLSFKNSGNNAPEQQTTNDYIDDPSGGSGDILYPSVYGWVFSGTGTNQAVLLNLTGSPYVVNLNPLSLKIANASYAQISDPHPADYIVDGNHLPASGTSTASLAYKGTNPATWVAGSAIKTTGSSISGAGSFTLPAYSITRIGYSP